MRQTDELLIVTHEQGDGAVMSRFAFDGSEVRSAGGGSARSTWEGVALLTTGKVPLPGGRGGEIKVREVRTLGPEGRTQMLTVTQRSPMGTQVMTVTLGRQGEN